ncbi:hypothetical protein GH741_17935 [Aquibacillus halophilus]|uniref:Uncharacterized protein n=1 Tax=Aquibacillus halophilus TaxID=930132 RepID=A0A6A8DFR3_9BACI|nr:hypothetical protein [Aquibacillus halophilus]MRH44528.1 hypothetical protein [Aquibacillus halophilus]
MNRRGIMNSVLTIGAAGAAAYGITRGVQNGTFQRLPQTISNALDNSQSEQPFQDVGANQVGGQGANPIRTIAEQEAENNNAHFEQW